MAGTILGETKRERQRKAKRCIATRGKKIKKKKEKASSFHGRKLSHPWPF
jgi:hypothetical protein